MDVQRVTRFEVIDHTTSSGDALGRALVKYGVSVTLSLQDDGRTLKVFLNDSDIATEGEVREEITQGLAEFIGSRANLRMPSTQDSCGVCTVYADGTELIRRECPVHGVQE